MKKTLLSITAALIFGKAFSQANVPNSVNISNCTGNYRISNQPVLQHKCANSNIFLGVGAGQTHLVNSQANNTFLGNNAGFSATGVLGPAPNTYNVSVGSQAGYNHTGMNATFVGAEAGYNSQLSDGQVYIGYRAGYMHNGSGGTGNTFVGYESGYSTQSSSQDNTFTGKFSGRNNTTGDQNSFFGIIAGMNSTTGSSNSFFGTAAGSNNGIYSANNYFGMNAGNTSTGDENCFMGNSTGQSGVGNKNVVLGNGGMANASSSNENVAIGYNINGTGSGNNYNSIIGSQAAMILGKADSNAFMGYKSAFNQSGGNQNAYLGSLTGNNIQTGQYNTFLGARADATNPNSNITNAAAIGAKARVTNSNHMIIGNNDNYVGIGLSGDATGPLNRLEINDVNFTPASANPLTSPASNGASGLKFRAMDMTTSPITNPGKGVLALDKNGNVIYVVDQTGGPGSGSGLGNLCGGPLNPITGDYEIPLNNKRFYFTGQSVVSNAVNQDIVSVGYNCGNILPAKFSVLEQQTTNPTFETFSGHFVNANSMSKPSSSEVTGGVYGEARVSPTPPFIDAYNVGGVFNGENARMAIGVLGRTSNALPTNPGAPMGTAIGGAFISINPVAAIGSIRNIGVYGKAAGASQVIGIYGEAPVAPNSYAVFSNGNQFSSSGSAWTTSDRRLKKNITDLDINASELISKLKTHQYYYDVDKCKTLNVPTEKQWGFIAQELEIIIPEMVKDHQLLQENGENGEMIKVVQYDRLFPVVVKALQEQQNEIDELKELVKTLLASNNSGGGVNPNSQNIDLSDKNVIVLNQNVPNPFAESTVITYNIPTEFSKAQIIFSTTDGTVIRSVDITQKGSGKLSVFANDLTNGLYTYSLVVDGKAIDTKKMIKGN